MDRLSGVRMLEIPPEHFCERMVPISSSLEIGERGTLPHGARLPGRRCEISSNRPSASADTTPAVSKPCIAAGISSATS